MRKPVQVLQNIRPNLCENAFIIFVHFFTQFQASFNRKTGLIMVPKPTYAINTINT